MCIILLVGPRGRKEILERLDKLEERVKALEKQYGIEEPIEEEVVPEDGMDPNAGGGVDEIGDDPAEDSGPIYEPEPEVQD